jgi:hypothetical protein
MSERLRRETERERERERERESKNVFDQIAGEKAKRRNKVIFIAAFAAVAVIAAGALLVVVFYPARKTIDEPTLSDIDDPNLVADDIAAIRHKVEEITASKTPDAEERAVSFLDTKIADVKNRVTEDNSFEIFLIFYKAETLLDMGNGQAVIDGLSGVREGNLDDSQKFALWALLKSAYSNVGDSHMANQYTDKTNALQEAGGYGGE